MANSCVLFVYFLLKKNNRLEVQVPESVVHLQLDLEDEPTSKLACSKQEGTEEEEEKEKEPRKEEEYARSSKES